jgi:DnaJ-class molecular chaperone
MSTRLADYLAKVDAAAKAARPLRPVSDPAACSECAGTGRLERLGGDWGKTPDTVVDCWRCSGTGKATNHVR